MHVTWAVLFTVTVWFIRRKYCTTKEQPLNEMLTWHQGNHIMTDHFFHFSSKLNDRSICTCMNHVYFLPQLNLLLGEQYIFLYLWFQFSSSIERQDNNVKRKVCMYGSCIQKTVKLNPWYKHYWNMKEKKLNMNSNCHGLFWMKII